ncbi:hypothetical protein SODALDRAFT_352804 [Sodiomyces alkalinus F11]|uniref:Uncharacterized protein n=1 Tax=Sodiomyces alkalinus (strain CBS 110278 / VKM F-3762 / F11) TaxID=1314773 RepID=A0A3N2PNM6_SODAK|nr:hypothetical protein SODALDRAFT_352804 [Sodiomyces alkalinus F11]ROT35946.1 hypothetical protein SODALDRAFT_352804 [Sodiomyces alkalinus F11]
MAIFDVFRRADRRKSILTPLDASGQSTGQINNGSRTSLKSDKSSTNYSFKLTKSFSWKSRTDSLSQTSNNTHSSCTESGEECGIANTLERPEKGVPSWLKKNNKKKQREADDDPREKPLTAVNLVHQEMLSQFTWTFGNRRDSIGDRSSLYGDISPGTSRLPSMDGGSRPLPPRHPSSEVQHQQRLHDMHDQDDQFLSPYAPMRRRAALTFD